MLKIDRDKRAFSRLDNPTMAQVSLLERQDLQECISNSPDDFFGELGQHLFLIGKELSPSETVADRIDLLALDKEGSAVIVELKRGSHKLHLLQAISYAGMVAHWEPGDFLARCEDSQKEALLDFIDVDAEEINRSQRIILLAEAFEYEVLVAAEWLTEQFGVDILCASVALARDPHSGQEYLACNTVYPAPELAAQARPRTRAREAALKPRWRDWDEVLAAVDNVAVVEFFRQELAAGTEHYLPKRMLRFRVQGKRRFGVSARRSYAYAWQTGRFEGDADFWHGGLTRPEDVTPVKDGTCLRFRLAAFEDFKFFGRAVAQKLPDVVWQDAALEDEEALSPEV